MANAALTIELVNKKDRPRAACRAGAPYSIVCDWVTL